MVKNWLDVTHRVFDGRGFCRAFVLRRGASKRENVTLHTQDGYAGREREFPSMEKLEAYLRQRRWELSRVNHFDEG